MTLRRITLISFIINFLFYSRAEFSPINQVFDQTHSNESTIVVNNIERQDESESRKNCDKFKCFDSFRCEINESKQLIYYVYPPLTFKDSGGNVIYSTRQMITNEYWQLLKTILSSSRLTLNPKEACIFVPSIDLTWLKETNSSMLGTIYNSLPFWDYVDRKPGTNHLLIALDPTLDIEKVSDAIGRAILVSNKHDTWTIIPEFDFSIPVISELVPEIENRKKWQLVFTQYDSITSEQESSISALKSRMNDKLLVLAQRKCPKQIGSEQRETDNHDSAALTENDKIGWRCSKYGSDPYRLPEVLSAAQYCLILHTGWYHLGDSIHYLLVEAIKRGCVPIISNDYVLPFSSLVDWSEISIILSNSETLENVATLISSIDPEKYNKMSQTATEIWLRHFRTPNDIATNIMRHYDSLVYPPVLLEPSNHFHSLEL